MSSFPLRFRMRLGYGCVSDHVSPQSNGTSLLRARCWRHHSVDTVVRHQQSVMLRGVLGHVHPRIYGPPEGTIRQSLKNGVGLVDRLFEHRHYSRLGSVVLGIEFEIIVPGDVLTASSFGGIDVSAGNVNDDLAERAHLRL